MKIKNYNIFDDYGLFDPYLAASSFGMSARFKGGSKPKPQVVGYHYSIGMHMILCQGPIDGVKQIVVGEKVVYPTANDPTSVSADSLTSATINQPNIFGGEDKEGGVVGTVDIEYGTSSQRNNDYLAPQLGGSTLTAKVNGYHSITNELVVDNIDNGITIYKGDMIELASLNLYYYVAEDVITSGGGATIVLTTNMTSGAADNDTVYIYRAANVPAFKGLVGVILRCVRVGTSPYIKQWSFLCKRVLKLQDGSTQWYPGKVAIEDDMNPAHIIRECLTNSQWGLGYSTGYLDDDSFEAAADTLYTEGFGLSFLWESEDPIEDFIQEVLNHIDGILYQDIENGKFTLKLVRDDYDEGDLETYDEDDISEVVDFTRDSLGETINQIVVKYRDEINDNEATATCQDIALMNLQGGNVIETNVVYRGITKAALAASVAARDLRQAGSLLARMTIIGNRKFSSYRPGDVFKLNWEALGIEGLLVRVVQLNYGSLTEGKVELSVVEDVFATSSALYATNPDTEWIIPITDPADISSYLLSEVPYWTLVKQLGDSYAQNTLDDDAGYLGVSVLKEAADALDYTLYVRDAVGLDFALKGNGDYTPSATIQSALNKNAQNATIVLENVQDLDLVVVGSYAAIGNELVKIESKDTATNEIEIARGVLDTVPEEHSASDRIWFVETASFFVENEYTVTETPAVKILPNTGMGRLDIDDATARTASAFNSRMIRPYPPGNVKINSQSYPSSFTGQPTISWAHRDRTQQTAYIIEHNESSIGPETGVTYTLKIYDEDDVLVRTETGLTGTSYTYSEADEISDCSIASGEPLNTQLRFVLYSVRDSYDSWQNYDITVARV